MTARKLSGGERKVSAVAGVLALAASVLLLYYYGHGFVLLVWILGIIGLTWLVWAIFGRYY